VVRDAVLQRPHGLVFGGFPVNGRWVKEAGWDNLLTENVIDELFPTFFRDGTLFPPSDILLEFGIVPDIASDAFGELFVQVEVSGMFALEGDEIPWKAMLSQIKTL